MLADDLDTGIHIHLNESLTEVENSKERFGRRPTEVAYDCGILYDRCIAAHCVWLSDAEIALMRETGTQISHNPSSNAKLGNGIARVPEMLAAGINVGLGPRRRRVQQQPRPVRGHEVRLADPPRQPGGPQPAAGARRGAHGDAQRRRRRCGHETGELTAGKKADVILVDLQNQMFTPLLPREQGAPVLAPGVRRERQRREHHDHRRPDRLRRARVHDDRRAEGAARGQRGVPQRARP